MSDPLFSPTLYLTSLIALISTVYLHYLVAWVGPSFWDGSWIHTHPAKSTLLFVVPAALIWAPTMEELLFRLPLLLLFERMDTWAQVGVIVSSVLFGACHALFYDTCPGFVIRPVPIVLSPREYRQMRRQIIVSTLGGLTIGTATVLSQRLWVPIVAHAIWNVSLLALVIVAQAWVQFRRPV